LEYADVRDAYLSGADLRDAYLRDADLRDANLRGADLRDANLRGADLRSANLFDADMRDANLRYADLRGADLRYADLRYADLRSANLFDADIDFSCLPLWCGGLNFKIDERQAKQLVYHVLNLMQYSNLKPEKIFKKYVYKWLEDSHLVEKYDLPKLVE
jgi:uncharacterized protein YjbI with pentapeptide repeats